MPKVSLNTIITDKFITRLAAAGKQGSSAPSNPLKGDSSVSLSGSLRLGAQTYATAVGALNNTLSVVNVAKDTLEKLGDITDKMIKVVEKAARRPVGPQGRRALDVQFRELADDFKKVIDKAKIGDKNFLTTEGLTELFLAVGLDKETSESIAGVFSKFVTPEDDTTLASEKVEGKKPLVIPAAAFTTRPSDAEYRIEVITDAPLTSTVAGISPNSNVFQATDDLLSENPGIDAVFAKTSLGDLTSQGAGNLQGVSATLMAVNEVTGYSVIKSTFDPTGENGSGDNQLFLLDETGAVVGQLTKFTPDIVVGSVDIASSDEVFAIQYLDVSTNLQSIARYEIAKGDPVNTVSISILDTSFDTLTDVKIDNAGEFIAFSRTPFGSNINNLELYGPDTGFDATVAADVRSRDPIHFGFAANQGQVVYSTTITTGDPLRDVTMYYAAGVAPYTELLANVEYDAFTTLPSDDAGTGGYFAFAEVSGGTRTVNVMVADDATSVYSFSLGDDTVSSLSLALNGGDPTRIDVGVVGSLPDIAGDADTEFYRISFNPNSIAGRRIRSDSTEYSEILDPSRNITSRPAAYRLLNDLKALREQITTNVGALKNAFDVVADNISLVRATGLALLEIGNELTNETDAGAVAESLRQRIRVSASEALAQAENLDPIAVATLTYTSSGN